jgi:hypothetical protein
MTSASLWLWASCGAELDRRAEWIAVVGRYGHRRVEHHGHAVGTSDDGPPAHDQFRGLPGDAGQRFALAGELAVAEDVVDRPRETVHGRFGGLDVLGGAAWLDVDDAALVRLVRDAVADRVRGPIGSAGWFLCADEQLDGLTTTEGADALYAERHKIARPHDERRVVVGPACADRDH